jgi:hypothetical protein
MDVIKSDEYGYFVVGYLGLAQRNQDDLDAIALTALSNEISDAIDAGTYQFGTDQPYDPAMPVSSSTVFDASTGEITLNITTTPTPAELAAPAAVDSSNPILIVLAIVGGVAIVGVIVVLVVNIAGGNKNGGNGADEPSKPAKKKAEPEPEEEPETDDEE